MSETKYFPITKKVKTAVLGQLDDNTQAAFIFLHGYGQQVEYVSRKFKNVTSDKRYFLFPEAPHRFYLEGFTGRIGTSWMTRYEREKEITEVNQYLNKVWEEVNESDSNKVVMGFSQGAYVATRWCIDCNIQAKYLILWGAGFPDDYFSEKKISKLSNTTLIFVWGKEDEFLSTQNTSELKGKLAKTNLKCEFVQYEGTHKVYSDVLKSLLEKLKI